MALNKIEASCLTSRLEVVNEQLKNLLRQATDKQETDETSQQLKIEPSSPAGEKEKNGAEVEFPRAFTRPDVALIGLALVRLLEASEDYVNSGGVKEATTFPCGPCNTASNIARVKSIQADISSLKNMFVVAHRKLSSLDAMERIREQAVAMRDTISHLLERTAG